jgi:Glycosyltransferase family 87
MSSGRTGHNQPDRLATRVRALEHVLLGVVPLALTVWLAVSAVSFHWVAQDFSLAYYPAAHRLLDGGSPYLATHAQIVSGAAFVYPALSAILLAPLALVGSGLADHLFTLICLAMVPATLWILAVRDWRVYGAALLWFPMIIGWQGENISVPLMFLIALAWRHRDRPLVAGLVVAAAVSMKPFIWPLGLWLIATRRFRAAVWALSWGVALNVVAWGVVGFDEISTFLHLSNEVTGALWRGGYSVLAMTSHLGLGRGIGEVVLVVGALATAGAMLYQGLLNGRERVAMVLAVALMLVASPLVWIHYFVLLLVPLAISRPRFDFAWTVPIAMWLLPSATSVSAWQLALAWALVVWCFAAALRAQPAARRRSVARPRAQPPPSPAATG